MSGVPRLHLRWVTKLPVGWRKSDKALSASKLASLSLWFLCGEVADTVRHAAAEKRISAITFRPSTEPASDSIAVLRNTLLLMRASPFPWGTLTRSSLHLLRTQASPLTPR